MNRRKALALLLLFDGSALVVSDEGSVAFYGSAARAAGRQDRRPCLLPALVIIDALRLQIHTSLSKLCL